MSFLKMAVSIACLLLVCTVTQAQTMELTKEAIKDKWQTDQQWVKERFLRKEVQTITQRNLKTGALTDKVETKIKLLLFVNGQSYIQEVTDKRTKFKLSKDGFNYENILELFSFEESQEEIYPDISFWRIQVSSSKDVRSKNYQQKVAKGMIGEIKVTSDGSVLSVRAELGDENQDQEPDKIAFKAKKVLGINVREMTVEVITMAINGRIVPKLVTVDYQVSGGPKIGPFGIDVVKKRCREVTEYFYEPMTPEEQIAYFNRINKVKMAENSGQ